MSLKNRLLFYGITSLVLLLILETCLRGYFASEYELPALWLQPDAMLETYYPGIDSTMEAQVAPNNGIADVLFLGGSVLHHRWSTIEPLLKARLENAMHCPVKIHNMGIPAHTSRDSRIKNELLEDKAYDAILLYHGINETRFNNCPAEFFQSDYTHVEFYRNVHSVTGPLSSISIIPHAIAFIKLAWMRKYSSQELVPFHLPENKEWEQYGKTARTSATFAANYSAIMQSASQRGIPVVAPSFAMYVPTSDSAIAHLDALVANEILSCNTNIWGIPENVQNAIMAHNQALNTLCTAENAPELLYCVDMDEELSKNTTNFRDICHLTTEGSMEFVDILAPVMLNALEKKHACSSN